MLKKNSKKVPTCSFCDRTEKDVDILLQAPKQSVYICNRCVDLCKEMISNKPKHHEFRPLKPQEIVDKFAEYVIGQKQAKKTIAVSVYNHYKRLRSMAKNADIEYSKSNLLLLGPTGSGKTLMAKTLAKMLDVPFAIADATTLTEAGYVGEDVENIILRLVQAADYDISRAEKGIIYIDEIDKIRRTTGNVSITRDVSGEGVQQALLKIVEGTIANVPPKGGRKHPNQEFLKVNTENILFIGGGAFVDLDKIIAKRLGSETIGFGAHKKERIDVDDHDTLLSQATPEDLVEFGLMPEFIGRFGAITNCNELKESDLIHILTEPKNAIIKQFKSSFEEEGCTLNFTDDALKAIAHLAYERKTGARALRNIVENLLLDLMFEVPSDSTIKEITVTKEAVEKGEEPDIKRSAS